MTKTDTPGDGAQAMLEKLDEAISALGRVQPVAVKPLEWRHYPDAFPPMWVTNTTIGSYHIEETAGSDSPSYDVLNPMAGPIANVDGLPEAKATAQADFEKRIMSALKPVAGAARLFDDHQPMSCEVGEITAAEDVLSWLIIEKCGAPDDRSYTPHEAQKIIEDALALATPPAPQLALASAKRFKTGE